MAGPDGPSKTASTAATTAAHQNANQKPSGAKLPNTRLRPNQPTYSDNPKTTGAKTGQGKPTNVVPSSAFSNPAGLPGDPLAGLDNKLDPAIAGGRKTHGQQAAKQAPAPAQPKPADKPAAHTAAKGAKTPAAHAAAAAETTSESVKPTSEVKHLYPGLKLSPHQTIKQGGTDYTPKQEGEAVRGTNSKGEQVLFVRSANQIWECPFKDVKAPFLSGVGPDGKGTVHYMPGDMEHVGERKTFAEMYADATSPTAAH